MAKRFVDCSASVGKMTAQWPGEGARSDRLLERVLRHENAIAPGVTRQVSTYWSQWHFGCHIDGQTHNVEGGLTIDKMPLSSFYGEGVIVDFRYMKKWQVVTAKDLENAKPRIKDGDVVLMNTGWHHYWRKDDHIYYSHYPGMYVEAGEWLLSKHVKMVGGTWGATDHILAHYPLRRYYPWIYAEYLKETGKDADKEFPSYEPCHEMFCVNGVPHIENVGGDVDEVTGKRCTIAAIPFKYPDAGHMVRVVAIVDE